MKIRLILVLGLCILLKQVPAQQNWESIPCFDNKWPINNISLDSLHNELILSSVFGSKNCNVSYKGIFAFNGIGFRDLDFGLDNHNPNPATGGDMILGSISFNGKTLFGGGFASVGSNALQAEAIALWDGAEWDTFPKKCFRYNPARNSPGVSVAGFLKQDGKLWIYGCFDTIGNVIVKNLCSFDGTNFIPVSNIPVTNNDYISKMIIYKNKLVACGPFYDYPSWSIARVAMYDGTSWSPVGSGVRGNIAFVYDMAVYRDTLYIAGTWSKADGNVSNHIMKWDGTQLHDAGFGNFYNWGAITSLVVFRDRLYAFGSFNYAADQKAWGVAYYENGAWKVPKDSILIHGPKYAVVYNDAIYMGGGFKQINGDTTIRNFARLVCPDFDAAGGCISGLSERTLRTNVKLFPNPVQEELKIELENSSTLYLTITNILGEILLSREEFSTSQRVDVSFLPPGVYMVNVNDGTRAFSNKFVKADR